MNLNEAYFFVAKSLTISFQEKNKKMIISDIKKNNVNWDQIVRVSTKHKVLTTLYCIFKRKGVLNFLPRELVEYMKEISQINRERNNEIIKQANEINKILTKNNIRPIFIKGAAYLLQNLYYDISERMIGDIDLICSRDDYQKVIDILKNDGYEPVIKKENRYPEFKHYPRLVKNKRIAAIEIHKELTIEKYSDEFNYGLIIQDIQNENNVSYLSFENQLNSSIISSQVDDYAFYYKNLDLKNAYDVILLSKKINKKISFSKFKKLKYILNCFLAATNYTFGEIDSLKYTKTKETEKYLNQFIILNKNQKKKILIDELKYKKLYYQNMIYFICGAIFKKENRKYLLNRMIEKIRFNKYL